MDTNNPKKANQKSEQGNTINATNPILNSSSFQEARIKNKKAASNAFKNANIEMEAGSSLDEFTKNNISKTKTNQGQMNK